MLHTVNYYFIIIILIVCYTVRTWDTANMSTYTLLIGIKKSMPCCCGLLKITLGNVGNPFRTELNFRSFEVGDEAV